MFRFFVLLLPFVFTCNVSAQSVVGEELPIIGGQVTGWAYDPDHPNIPIEVHVYADGDALAIASTIANLPSPVAPIGGNHGFSLAIPSQYFDGLLHVVHVFGIDVDGVLNPELTHSPQSFQLSASYEATDRVFFAPNFKSAGLLALFTSPSQWAVARSHTDIFHFYPQQLAFNGCPASFCGGNTFEALVAVDAFKKLKDWGIKTAMSAGVIKSEQFCDGSLSVTPTLQRINNIVNANGSVEIIAMDEPFFFSQSSMFGCSGFLMSAAAAEVVEYVAGVRAQHPNLEIGTYEPYPAIPIYTPTIPNDDLIDWISTLSAALAAAGQPGLSFFYLDINREHPNFSLDPNGQTKRDIQLLKSTLVRFNIRFGVVLQGAEGPTDQDYYNGVFQYANFLHSSVVGHTEEVILQNWAESVFGNGERILPSNLPETKNFTHTKLLLDVLELYFGIETSGMIFANGFENGSLSGWSAAVGN